MTDHFQNIVIGQGLAGSCAAWALHLAGQDVLLLDREDAVTASKVAAGLITPFTGQRMVKTQDFDDEWVAAIRFYRIIEQITGASFFDCSDMILLTADGRPDDLPQWRGVLQTNGTEYHGVTMSPAGRLNVASFLLATREYFRSRGHYRCVNVDLQNDVAFVTDGAAIEQHRITADRIIVCLGATTCDLFSAVPNNPSRGDILKVCIPDFACQQVVHRSLWIAPNDDGTQSVGATYDWKTISYDLSMEGRREILGKLNSLVTGPIEVVDHLAAVRPTMKDYQPVVGQHPMIASLFVLNGLGSKGTLRAPTMANLLTDLIIHQKHIPAQLSPERLLAKAVLPNRRPKPLTAIAQDFMAAVLKPGDTAVDGTVGNGFDTCFLAEQVGASGRVIGFDVQDDAIASTQQRLTARGLHHVELRHHSHERIAELPPDSITAAMFNLGFLPRSDHTIITQPESSTVAISAALQCLRDDGAISVLCYRGHNGGPEEFAAVERLLEQARNRYDVRRIDSDPPKTTSPVLFIVMRSSR